MKLNLAKNWVAKAMSLLLAIAIWFLIKQHLGDFPGNPSSVIEISPRRAVPVDEETLLPRR